MQVILFYNKSGLRRMLRRMVFRDCLPPPLTFRHHISAHVATAELWCCPESINREGVKEESCKSHISAMWLEMGSWGSCNDSSKGGEKVAHTPYSHWCHLDPRMVQAHGLTPSTCCCDWSLCIWRTVVSPLCCTPSGRSLAWARVYITHKQTRNTGRLAASVI